MPVYTGETFDSRTTRTETLPDLGSDEGHREPFHFISSPGSWECIDLLELATLHSQQQGIELAEAQRDLLIDPDVRWEWVPRLKKFHHTPGVNGVSARAGGLARALGEYRGAGWTIIEPDQGPGGTSYIRRLKTRRGIRYVDAWTSYVAVGIGRMAPRFDDVGWLQWRRELVREGIVTAPPPEVLEGATDLVSREIGRLESRAHLPHVQTRIEQLIAKLAGMRAGKFPTASAAKTTRSKRSRA